MCRIGEAVPHVKLPVVISSLAATDLNVALAVERQHVIGPCPKTSRRQGQLHDVRIVLLIHARGDLVFAPTHWGSTVVIPKRGYDYLRGNAYHEAGHAVVGGSLGLRVGEITIRDDRPGENAKIAGAGGLSLVEQIAVYAAGSEAGVVFERPLPASASRADREEIFNLLAAKEIRAPQEIDSYYRAGQKCARKLLRKHERKVHKVAARLIERRHMDASEFKSLMEPPD
jgi:hypothetical protein